MGSGFSALQFAKRSYAFNAYFNVIFYAYSGVCAASGLVIMAKTQGCLNTKLLLLLTGILLYSVLTSLCYFLLIKNGTYTTTLSATSFAIENALHWLVTETYIRVSI